MHIFNFSNLFQSKIKQYFKNRKYNISSKNTKYFHLYVYASFDLIFFDGSLPPFLLKMWQGFFTEKTTWSLLVVSGLRHYINMWNMFHLRDVNEFFLIHFHEYIFINIQIIIFEYILIQNLNYYRVVQRKILALLFCMLLEAKNARTSRIYFRGG